MECIRISQVEISANGIIVIMDNSNKLLIEFHIWKKIKLQNKIQKMSKTYTLNNNNNNNSNSNNNHSKMHNLQLKKKVMLGIRSLKF